MKRLMIMLSVAFALLLTQSVFAWDSTGHRIIAQIAYDHLSNKAKRRIDRITYSSKQHYSGDSRFLYAATWADRRRDFAGDHRFDRWHYIDLPISKDKVAGQLPNQNNVVSGLAQTKKILQSHRLAHLREQTYFNLFIHMVGDIHQPLHTTTQYSKRHPRGDFGGHGFKIKSHTANNLHAYWDQGLGDFHQYGRRYPLKGKSIRTAARQISHRYPKSQFGKQVIEKPFLAWAKEGRAIAKRDVYLMKPGRSPSAKYRRKGRKLVEQRIALAGYRLANQLNQLYGY